MVCRPNACELIADIVLDKHRACRLFHYLGLMLFDPHQLQHAPGRAWHLIANTENLAAVVLGHEGRFFGGSGVGPHDGLA